MISPPPGAAPVAGAAPALSTNDPDEYVYDYLRVRLVRPINLGTLAAGRQLLGRACLLVGWSLRETTGNAPAQCEFFDGPDANGTAVAEVTLAAPLPGSVGNSDVDIDASSAGGAQANNVTLAGAAGATTFITGFEITGAGATGASVIVVTVTGILGGTKTYELVIPAGAGVSITPLLVEFGRPIPASAVNTAIVVNVPSFGAGNTNAAVTAHGFQRTVGGAAGSTGSVATQSAPGDGLLCRSGLFLRMIAGSVTGSVWVRI